MVYNTEVVLSYYRDQGIDLTPEYLFSPDRGFRFDFASPEHKVAIEVQGGIWKGKRGGHTSGVGYKRDMEKFNLAASLGWRVVQCEPSDLCMDDFAEIVVKTLEVSRRERQHDLIGS